MNYLDAGIERSKRQVGNMGNREFHFPKSQILYAYTYRENTRNKFAGYAPCKTQALDVLFEEGWRSVIKGD